MGKTVELHFATKDKYVHHIFTHRLIKKSLKNSTAIKSYERNKKVNEVVVHKRMNWVVLGSIPGGRTVFGGKKFQFIFKKINFPVFSNGFVFIKKFL